MAEKGVFLDRDGVLNRLIFNPATSEFESPHRPEDVVAAGGLESLLALQDAGYSLFVVSNQPSFAKGKCSMEDLQAVHAVLELELLSLGLALKAFFYCYHHPDSVVPELKGPCPCRKPSPFFIEQAFGLHGIGKEGSWMIGDQDSDIECGQAAGLKCILLETPESAKKRGKSSPDARVQGLSEAVQRILGS